MTSLDKAELLMAELHQVLLTKTENHDLDVSDLLWLERTRPFHESRIEDLDVDAIILAIQISRLSGDAYESPILKTPITAALLKRYWDEIVISEYKKNKKRVDTG